MERTSKRGDVISNTHYSSVLLLTLLASFGFCCAILKVLPLTPSTGWDADGRNFTIAIMRLCISGVFFYLIVCTVWAIKNREALHRRQLVFWPMRCRHCARVVGSLFPKYLAHADPDARLATQKRRARRWSLPTVTGTGPMVSNLNEFLRSNELTSEPGERNVPCLRDIVAAENCNPIHSSNLDVTKSTQNELNRSRRTFFERSNRPHRSLLILFNVFGTISLINIPIEVIGIVFCLVTNHHVSDAPIKVDFNLICEGVFNVIVAVGLACYLVFFNKFYDAVFLENGNFPTIIGMYFASGLILLSLKLVYPLGDIEEHSHETLIIDCGLPEILSQIIRSHTLRITPLYTQVSLLAVSILWKLWTSICRESCLRIDTEAPAEFQHIYSSRKIPISEYIKKPLRSLNKLARMGKRRFGVCQIILISVLLVAIFYLFNKFVVSRKSFDLSNATRTYILWCCNLICFLPFIALYRYQLFLSGNLDNFRIKHFISLPHELVQSHDIILMLGCSGMFMLNIFRMVAIIGIFVGYDTVPRDELSLACFGLVYCIAEIYVVSSTTSFLLIIQRQHMRSEVELKFVMICLMYTICLNATNWLSSVVDISGWKELTIYYGPVIGIMIGRFLQPVIWLYFLHASIVAFETYKDVKNTFHEIKTRKMLYTDLKTNVT